MFKKLEKGLNITFYIVITVAIIFALSLFITNKVTGKANIFGYKPFFIMSPSMEPVIMTHQLVLAKTIDASKVQIGDIVAYDKDNSSKTVIHRIIDINEDGTFIFKGDNNEERDKDDIRPEQILYKIVWY